MTDPIDEFEAMAEIILYNLESEYLTDFQRVFKGKDTGAEMAKNNADSSRRATRALRQAAIKYADARVATEQKHLLILLQSDYDIEHLEAYLKDALALRKQQEATHE